MALFLMPEMGLKFLSRTPAAQKWHGTIWFRWVSELAHQTFLIFPGFDLCP